MTPWKEHGGRTAVGTPRASGNILGRWLHFGMALCVVLCLALAAIAGERGTATGTPGGIAFVLHKFIGLNALLLILLYLFWSALGHAKSTMDIFPWFSPRRLAGIAAELRAAGRSGIARTTAAAQGLGVTFALVASATGMADVLWTVFDGAGARRDGAGLLRIHVMAAELLWPYLAIHASAALWHALGGGKRGDVRRMFALASPHAGTDASSGQ